MHGPGRRLDSPATARFEEKPRRGDALRDLDAPAIEAYAERSNEPAVIDDRVVREEDPVPEIRRRAAPRPPADLGNLQRFDRKTGLELPGEPLQRLGGAEAKHARPTPPDTDARLLFDVGGPLRIEVAALPREIEEGRRGLGVRLRGQETGRGGRRLVACPTALDDDDVAAAEVELPRESEADASAADDNDVGGGLHRRARAPTRVTAPPGR